MSSIDEERRGSIVHSIGWCECPKSAVEAREAVASVFAELASLRAERLILARALLDDPTPAGRAEAFAIAKRVREEGT